jgi:hypothetical protein
MARAPKQRVSYNGDASFLTRLSMAVERDETRPAEWRKTVLALIQPLVTELMSAPEPGSNNSKKSKKSKRKTK